MKKYNQIKNEIAKKAEKIKANEAAIMQMNFIDERRAAADCKDFETVKRLRDEAKANNDKIIALSAEIPFLKVQIAILQENVKAALVVEYLPKIAEILKPYEGKKYGEKTREKTREAAHKQGFSFYFDNRGAMVFYPLSKDGYRLSSDNDCRLIANHGQFITDENVLQFSGAEILNKYRYTENTAKKAREIIKAFEKMQKAAKAAEMLQSEYNSLIPEKMPRMDKISKYNDLFRASYF